MSMRSYSERLYGVNVTNIELSLETKIIAIKTILEFDKNFFIDKDCYSDAEYVANYTSLDKVTNDEYIKKVENIFDIIEEEYEGDSCNTGFWSFFADYVSSASKISISYSCSNVDYYKVIGMPEGYPWLFRTNEKSLESKDVEELLKKYLIFFNIHIDYDDAFWCYYEAVEFFG